MSHRFLLTLVLCTVPLVSQAKSTSKMTEGELVETLLHDKSRSQREKAADALGEQRAVGAIPALREGCRPAEEQSVCEHSLRALELLRTVEAKEAIASVLIDDTVSEYLRKMALRVLGRVDKQYAGMVAPGLLVRYRSLDGDFISPLLAALVDGGNRDAMDFTVVIATDTSVPKPARINALDAAERFGHPRLYEVYVSLIEDPDKGVRVRCAKELGTAGLPPEVVVPALSKAARFDDKGDVRAAAMKSLRSYVSPELLPLVNQAVVSERNVVAWAHAMAMFEVLADSSSLGALQQLFVNEFLANETQINLIHAAIRIGDPVVVPSLQTLADTTEDAQVRTEALNAIALLSGPVAVREEVIHTWVMHDIVVIDPTVTVTVAPPLSVVVSADGSVSWSGWMGLPSVTVTP